MSNSTLPSSKKNGNLFEIVIATWSSAIDDMTEGQWSAFVPNESVSGDRPWSHLFRMSLLVVTDPMVALSSTTRRNTFLAMVVCRFRRHDFFPVWSYSAASSTDWFRPRWFVKLNTTKPNSPNDRLRDYSSHIWYLASWGLPGLSNTIDRNVCSR